MKCIVKFRSILSLSTAYFIFSQEERSSFLSRDGDEDDNTRGLYSTTITKPVVSSGISPSSTLKTEKQQPASFLLSDVVTRGSSSLNTTYR